MIWLIIIGVLVAILALSAWWWVPQWQIGRLRNEIADAKDRAEIEDNFRKSIGQLIGGLAFILTGGIAYYQTQQTLQVQRNQTQDTIAAQDEQSKRTVVSQQVSKGFELLSDDKNIVKRLGGIYALEGVMNTSGQYHESVLDTLCAFVRDSTELLQDGHPMATDVQAALNVIKRRTSGPGRLMLSGAHIPGAVLDDANLIGAYLDGTDMSQAHAYSVDLSGGASLLGAHLEGADMFAANLSGANLNRAHLEGAKLISAVLNKVTLFDAILSNINLNGADLTDAKMTRARLDGADLRDTLHLTQAQLDEACGTGTRLPAKMIIKPCPISGSP